MAARVLVVEDDITVIEVLSADLTRAGYEVAGSDDGSEALQTWPRFAPNVVILDIMLPSLSGLDVLRHCSDWRCSAAAGAWTWRR